MNCRVVATRNDGPRIDIMSEWENPRYAEWHAKLLRKKARKHGLSVRYRVLYLPPAWNGWQERPDLVATARRQAEFRIANRKWGEHWATVFATLGRTSPDSGTEGEHE